MNKYDISALLHLAAMMAVRPCECEGNCDTCAPCLARAVLGVEEPGTPALAPVSLVDFRKDLL